VNHDDLWRHTFEAQKTQNTADLCLGSSLPLTTIETITKTVKSGNDERVLITLIGTKTSQLRVNGVLKIKG
jgi:hypothetical protein